MRPTPIAILTLCLAAGAATAAESRGPTLHHVLNAVPAPGEVVADGDLGDWDARGAIVLADDRAAPTKLVQVAAMYDAAGVWLAFRFRDPSPMRNRVDPQAARGRAWCGDCVQLRIGTGARHGRQPPGQFELLHVDAYWFSDGARATAYAVYGDFSPGGKTWRTIDEAEGAGVRSGYRVDEDRMGYVQELRLDWALLRPAEAQPYRAGESLRLALEPMWGDSRFRDKPAQRLTDLLDPDLPERAHAWANHKAWGRLVFVGPGGELPGEGEQPWREWCSRFVAAEEAPREPDAAVRNTPPCSDDDQVGRLINGWHAAGTAAGNTGEAYDNRDREHSPLPIGRFPQLGTVTYDQADLLAGRDYALCEGVRAQVVFGNSSTSGMAEGEGCNYRSAVMSPHGMQVLHAQYRSGNLYVYPAHHDYHPGRGGRPYWGDLVPVNSPYVLLSRGSSGSDQPLLAAAIRASAAMRPEVKRLLVRHGLLMPSIQRLLRATYGVDDPDYFCGMRHPPVFEGDRVDLLAMVEAAHAMATEDVPPLAQVAVVGEDEINPGIDAPPWAGTQRLCDTPCAVGRVFRGWGRTMRLTVSAMASFDVAGRPLQWRWVLLQGDPHKVRIRPRQDGGVADLEIDWHDRFPVQPGSAIETNRVDVGVFAGNGRTWSPPAFVSVLCPDNELRTFDERGLTVEIAYQAFDCTIGYDTPHLLPADGVAPYDVRDWPALLRAAADVDGAFGRLCAETLSADERGALAALAAELGAALEADGHETPGGDIYRRWQAEAARSRELSRMLCQVRPGLAQPARARLESLLNSWIDDPRWYLARRERLDAAIAAAAPADAAAIATLRDGLLARGFYVRAGTTLQVPPAATRGARAAIARFHLAVLTRALLPGVLVREPTAHVVDPRLAPARASRFTFEHADADGRPERALELAE